MVPFWCKTLTGFCVFFLYAAPKQFSTFFGNRKSMMVPFWFKTLTFLCVCVCAAQLAFCGELLDICMTLPYTDFLPPTFPIHIVIKVNIVKRWELCRLVLESWQVGCFVSLTCYHHIHFLPPTFTVHIVMKVNVVKQWCCVCWYFRDVPEASTFWQQQYLAMATLFVMLTVKHHAAVIITVIFFASDISHPCCDPGKHCQTVVLCLLVL